MIPYFIVLVLATCLAALSDAWGRQPGVARRRGRFDESPARFRERPRLNAFDWTLMAILAGFAGLRSGVGTDYATYADAYSRVDIYDWWGTIQTLPQEPGYTVLSLLTRWVFQSPQAIFWVTGSLAVVLSLTALRGARGTFAMVVFLYIALAYYVVPFNLVRQGLAMAILLWADRAYNRSRLAWLLLVLLASSFHVSALFFGALFLLARRLKPSPALVAASLFAGVVIGAVSRVVPQFESFVTIFNDRYSDYISDGGAGLGTSLTIVFKSAAVIYLLILSRGKEVNRQHQVLATLSLMFLVAGLSSKVMARMDIYFGVFIVCALAEAVGGRRDAAVHKVVLAVAGTAYFALYLLSYGDLIPYNWVGGPL